MGRSRSSLQHTATEKALFNRIDADVYCLEYDSARAGDFSPLRHVPKGKRVILGLGPQCGFSSGGGQPITQGDTRRKLELIIEVSEEIWGNT